MAASQVPAVLMLGAQRLTAARPKERFADAEADKDATNPKIILRHFEGFVAGRRSSIGTNFRLLDLLQSSVVLTRPYSPPPIGICTKCKKVTYAADQINRGCGASGITPRCTGIIISARDPDDWSQCGTCKGSGKFSDGPCNACQGTGWRYIRRT